MTEKNKKNQKVTDEEFMKLALKQAQKAFEEQEVPIGAVLVHNNKIILKAHNQVELLNDVTAHAELIAISSAGEHFQSKYLKGCTLYVTLEPCPMCAGAIGWAQISRLVIGASDPERGYRAKTNNILHPKCEVTDGVLAKECKQILDDFFQSKR